MESTYLEFTDYEDTEYNFEDNNLTNEDEFSMVSSAWKAATSGPSKKLKWDRDYKRKKRTFGSGYRKTNFLDKAAQRYRENRKEDAREKFANKRVEAKARIKDRDKDLKQEKRSSFFKKHKGTAIGAGAGAVAGGIAGNLLTSKLKKEKALLQAKPTKSPEDLEKIKSLSRKITAATVGGAALGGVAGGLAGKKFIKK